MSSSTKLSPFSQAYTYLHKVATSLEEGDRMPSVRTIIEKCNVSGMVVGKAMARLQAEGVVRIFPRSGIYRTKQPKKAGAGVVDVLYFGSLEGLNGLEATSFHNEVLNSLRAGLSQKAAATRLHIVQEEPDPEEIIRLILQQDDPEFITSRICHKDLGLIQPLLARKIPCLHLFPNMSETITPSLTVDDDQMVRQQVEHLVELGHRRIAFLHAQSDPKLSRAGWARKNAFCRLVVEHELIVKPNWICYAQQHDPARIHKTIRAFMSDKDHPTALIIPDAIVRHLYAALRECGLVPGRDVSVMGTDDMPWAEHVDPPLTSVRLSRTDACAMALEAMKRIRAGEELHTQYVPTKLMIRQSTGKIPVSTN